MPTQLLKHCPFCGLTDLDVIHEDEGQFFAVTIHTYPGGSRVECEACGCNGPWHNDYQSALEAWDKRHTEPSQNHII
jgi:Lar family restriction alleviation protein